jgi:hypothetical protein
MARIIRTVYCKLRVRCSQDGNRAPCSPTTGSWSAFEMKTGMYFLSSLSLSLFPPIFSSCACRWPSTVFLLCYVNCDMPSFFSAMVKGGGVCMRGGRAASCWCRFGAVLVLFLSCGEKFFQPNCRRPDNNGLLYYLHRFVGLQILVPSFPLNVGLNLNPFLNMNWTQGTNCIGLLMAIFLNQIARNIIVRIQTSSIKYRGLTSLLQFPKLH